MAAFLVTVVVVVGAIAALFFFSPYVPKKAWKQPVKLLVLLVTLVGAATNFVWSFVDGTTGANAVFATILSYGVLGCSLLLIAVFLFVFWRSMLITVAIVSLGQPPSAPTTCSSRHCARYFLYKVGAGIGISQVDIGILISLFCSRAQTRPSASLLYGVSPGLVVVQTLRFSCSAVILAAKLAGSKENKSCTSAG